MPSKNENEPKAKQTNTVKWVCITVLVMFFVTWATILLIPFGFFAAFLNLTNNVFKSQNTKENVVISEPYHIRPPKIITKIKPTAKNTVIERYLYIIYLKNGGTIKAANLKNNGSVYSVTNENGLFMKIAKADIDSIKKMKL